MHLGVAVLAPFEIVGGQRLCPIIDQTLISSVAESVELHLSSFLFVVVFLGFDRSIRQRPKLNLSRRSSAAVAHSWNGRFNVELDGQRAELDLAPAVHSTLVAVD